MGDTQIPLTMENCFLENVSDLKCRYWVGIFPCKVYPSPFVPSAITCKLKI